MTQGVLSPADYYYRGAYVDCLRALDVLGAQPEVDPSRIGLTGVSQGGALTLAVAALDPQRRARLAMPDVPCLCHFRRAVDVASVPPIRRSPRTAAPGPSGRGGLPHPLLLRQHEPGPPRHLPGSDQRGLAGRLLPPLHHLRPPTTTWGARSRRRSRSSPTTATRGPTHVLDKLRWARAWSSTPDGRIALRVLVTHGLTPALRRQVRRAVESFCDNLRRYRAGQPPRLVVRRGPRSLSAP